MKQATPKSEASVPQGGQMPELTQAIMPDYPRWNRHFFRLDCVFALLNLLLGCLFFVFSWREQLLTLPPDLYALLYLLLPSVLNLLVLVGAAVLREHLPERDARQNEIPVFAMLLMCLCVCLVHGTFFVTLAVFCLPICMTTVYNSQGLCRTTTLVSLAGALITLVRQFLATSGQDRLLVLPRGMAVLCVLLALGSVARTALEMMEEQKQKLFRFAEDARAAQETAETASEVKEPSPAEAASEVEVKDLSPAEPPRRQSFQAPSARVLIVDDVAVNLEVIINLLKPTGIRVDTAISGRRCLDMVTRAAYDLIFMDHVMPGMDGMETYAAMQKQENSLNRNTPVIMLTANAADGVREEFLQAGFADYLCKPVSGDNLESMLLKYLPREKIRTGTASREPVLEEIFPDETRSYPKQLRKLRRLYPKADLSKGLQVSGGSFSLYLDLLQTYLEQAAAADRLDALFQEKASNEYRVCVHGIKSASLSVGFSELAAWALTLENAAQAENWNVIESGHAAFLAEYRLALDAVRQALQL